MTEEMSYKMLLHGQTDKQKDTKIDSRQTNKRTHTQKREGEQNKHNKRTRNLIAFITPSLILLGINNTFFFLPSHAWRQHARLPARLLNHAISASGTISFYKARPEACMRAFMQSLTRLDKDSVKTLLSETLPLA